MNDINQILKENNFHFNKRYGQNFITDKNLLSAIVSDSGIGKGDNVLEIGAGAGSLTAALCQKAARVVAFEIDKNLQQVLSKALAEYKNIELYFEDIMQADIERIEKIMGDGFHIVANLPYYITTPIIMKFLESNLNILSYTVMVQKEVALRLTAKPNTKDYGAITVAIDYLGDARITRTVSRKLFYPEPNVDSAIVNIKTVKNKYPIDDVAIFKKVYKSAFKMRRKTLVNNLSSDFSISKEQVKTILIEQGINEEIRGESLSTLQLVNISNAINA